MKCPWRTNTPSVYEPYFIRQQERGWNHIHFSLRPPPAQRESDIYFQLYIWNDHNVFLIASLVSTSLLLDEINQLIELLFEWFMMEFWFLFVDLRNLVIGFLIQYLVIGKDLNSHQLSPLQYKQTDKELRYSYHINLFSVLTYRFNMTKKFSCKLSTTKN